MPTIWQIGALTAAFPPRLWMMCCLVRDVISGELGCCRPGWWCIRDGDVCLFNGQGYEEVARLLTEGLQRQQGWCDGWRVPSTAAIWKARSRLGVEPVNELFAGSAARRPQWALMAASTRNSTASYLSTTPSET